MSLTPEQREAWRKAQCEGKEAYLTFTMANRIARRRKRSEAGLVPFHCKWCGHFHIGAARKHERRPRFMEAAE